MNAAVFQIKGLPGKITFTGQGKGLISKSKGRFSGVMKNVFKTANLKDKNTKEQNLTKDLNGLRGHESLARLKEHFLSIGIPLNQMTVSSEAFPAFEQFLIDAGFQKNDVIAIFQDLEVDVGKKNLKLSDLFAKLTALDIDADAEDKESFIEISAVPYIEGVLSCFGLNREEINDALSGAKTEKKGIKLPVLISNLKKSLNDMPENGRAFPDAQSRNQIDLMVTRLGLEDAGKAKGAMTLERFVIELEDMMARGSAEFPVGKELFVNLKKFMGNVEIHRDMSDAEKRLNLLALQSSDSEKAKNDHLLKHFSVNKTLQKGFLDKNLPKDEKTLNEIKKIMNSKVKEMKGNWIEKNASQTDQKMDENFLAPENTVKNVTGAQKASAVSGQGTAVKSLPTYVVDQVGRQLLKSMKNGENEIRLQLKPPYLGRLHMSIETVDESIRVKIVTEQHATRGMLMSHANELKTAFIDQGLRLEKVDVQMTYNFDQFMANTRQQSNNSRDRRRQGLSIQNDRRVSDSPDQGMSETLRRRDGILDLVA